MPTARRNQGTDHARGGLAVRALGPGPRGRAGYAEQSRRPLHILVFLLPLVVLYEAGSVVYLADPESGAVETIRAHSILAGFFRAFDVAGLFLPGVALVTVLLVWHILNGDRWRLRPGTLAGMLVESIVWTLPLLVLSLLVLHIASAAPPAAAGGPAPDLLALPWQARLTISIGAGLYEELLFRMIGIAALHLVLVDLARLGEGLGRALAIAISAAAFALYHDLAASGGGLDIGRVLFFFTAGAYFGTIYLVRGFGIVVGVHALYDVLVLVLLTPPQ